MQEHLEGAPPLWEPACRVVDLQRRAQACIAEKDPEGVDELVREFEAFIRVNNPEWTPSQIKAFGEQCQPVRRVHSEAAAQKGTRLEKATRKLRNLLIWHRSASVRRANALKASELRIASGRKITLKELATCGAEMKVCRELIDELVQMRRLGVLSRVPAPDVAEAERYIGELAERFCSFAVLLPSPAQVRPFLRIAESLAAEMTTSVRQTLLELVRIAEEAAHLKALPLKPFGQELYDAVKSRDLAATDALLKAELYDPSKAMRGGGGPTPLVVATKADDSEMVKLLLRHRTNVDVPDAGGMTPLHVARSVEVAKLLIEHKAQVLPDRKLRTPLHTLSGDVALAVLPRARFIVNWRDRDDTTCLLHAVRQGEETFVKAILDARRPGTRADPDIRDKLGMVALHVAAENGSAALAKLLLDAKASMHVKRFDGQTPVDLARGEARYLVYAPAEATVEPLAELVFNAKVSGGHADHRTMRGASCLVLTTSMAELLVMEADLDPEMRELQPPPPPPPRKKVLVEYSESTPVDNDNTADDDAAGTAHELRRSADVEAEIMEPAL
jgi:ankyrin repeat protein